jgi:hypothetical protein
VSSSNARWWSTVETRQAFVEANPVRGAFLMVPPICFPMAFVFVLIGLPWQAAVVLLAVLLPTLVLWVWWMLRSSKGLPVSERDNE